LFKKHYKIQLGELPTFTNQYPYTLFFLGSSQKQVKHPILIPGKDQGSANGGQLRDPAPGCGMTEPLLEKILLIAGS